MQRSITAMTDTQVSSRSPLPRELLVLSVVIASLVHQAVAALVFMALLAATQTLDPGGLPLLFAAVPLQLVLTLGLACSARRAHVFFRDLGQMLGLVFMTWFYLT